MRAIDDLDAISSVVTQRTSSIFEAAMAEYRDHLAEAFEGRTLLISGGAGFIATQTIKQLLPFRPGCLIVADSDENRLAELVRTLRSGGLIPRGMALEPRLVDITTPMVHRLADEFETVDRCLQFAAAKHVRTERDPISLLRLLQVNLLGTMALTEAIAERFPQCRHFVVSTDKAADPANFMGASKRLMEMAVLGTHPHATTARFANVAFSNGSLLESWVIRLRAGQPLAVPGDTWRYFVSPLEAGQLCALASVAPAGSTVVPDESAAGLVELTSALDRVLAAENLQPVVVADEADVGGVEVPDGGYPVVVTKRDTSGEKRAEEFVGARETRQDWLPALGIIQSDPTPAPALEFAQWLSFVIANPGQSVTMPELTARVAQALPEFARIEGGHRLDDRM